VAQSRNAERDLTARSVVASTLLGTSPPRLPVALLVRAAELFGISEGTTRVALSRMATAGEVVAVDGSYELAGRLLARQSRQVASRAARTTAWSGGWLAAIVTVERRSAADRAAWRSAMSARRLGELREGVWMRPDNLGPIDPLPADLAAHCTLIHDARPENEATLTRSLWDLEAWAARAGELRRELRPLLRPLDRHDTRALAPGFVTSAAVLRHFQADPLLPAELLPARWPGAALREEYDRFDAAYRAVLREWFRINT
jgi:phenylacetic acid degradation operon negative regulatory protein